MRPRWSNDKIIFITILIIIIALIDILIIANAKSEIRLETECWILCQPDSYVNARLRPNKKSDEVARLDCGDRCVTDGKRKNGYIHLVKIGEWGEAWVYKGYVVFDEPSKPILVDTTVTSNGRVAARQMIGGKRRCWLKDGQKIKVYMVSEEWSVTNKGFVKTKYVNVGRR